MISLDSKLVTASRRSDEDASSQSNLDLLPRHLDSARHLVGIVSIRVPRVGAGNNLGSELRALGITIHLGTWGVVMNEDAQRNLVLQFLQLISLIDIN